MRRVRVGVMSARVPNVDVFFGRPGQLERLRQQSASERRVFVGWWATVAALLMGVLVGLPVALLALVVLALWGERAAAVFGVVGVAYVVNGALAFRVALGEALEAGLAARGLGLALVLALGGGAVGCAGEVVEAEPLACEPAPVACELLPEDPPVACPWPGAVVLACDAAPLPSGCANIGQAAPLCVDGSPAGGGVLLCCCEGWGSPGYDCHAAEGGAS